MTFMKKKAKCLDNAHIQRGDYSLGKGKALIRAIIEHDRRLHIDKEKMSIKKKKIDIEMENIQLQ